MQRAEREVPEYDEFKPVEEDFSNPLKELVATDFMIQIRKPPVTIENHETKRYLEAIAYKLPAPYKSSILLAKGNKEEILKKLQDPEFVKQIEEEFRVLSKNLEDV